MVRQLCFRAYIDVLNHWRSEDSFVVPQSDHQKIEDLFDDLIELCLDIENNGDEFYLFDRFFVQLNTIIDTINHLKNIEWSNESYAFNNKKKCFNYQYISYIFH